MLDVPFICLTQYENDFKATLEELGATENTSETTVEGRMIRNKIFMQSSVIESIKEYKASKNFPQYCQKKMELHLYRQFLNLEEPHEINSDLIYFGQHYKKQSHGFGKLASKKSQILFEGYFVFGMMHGPGRIIFSKGDVFEGEWFFNKVLSGNYYDEKLKLKIIVKELHIDFPAIRSQANYNGNIVNNLREGFGRYQWEDGTHYIGEFKNNEIVGFGKMIFKDGRIYKGYWKNNMMEGLGQFNWPNGQIYIGGYQQDKKHGVGMVYTQGKTQISMFHEGKLRTSIFMQKQLTF